jgi:hypothetical protein
VRATVGIGAIALALLAVGCAANESTESGTVEPIVLLGEPLQLAGDDLGSEVHEWDTMPERAIVVYRASVCSEPECESKKATLFAVDERGEPWVITDLNDDAQFEIDGEGTVRVSVPGEEVQTFAMNSPAPVVQKSVESVPRVFEGIPGFEPHNDIVAVLSDGSFLIRGRWDGDELMETWLQFVNEPERTSEFRRPIRLFLHNPINGDLAPVSGIPVSREASTAVADSFGPDTVLRVQLLAGERAVAYSVGFNGPAYDVEYALYLAPLPAKSQAD